MSILTSLVLLMSLLFLEKASPYSSQSSSNFCLISVVRFLSCSCTLGGPGTSAGEQIKAVSCGISGNVSCLWGTQFHGLARCSLILSSLASSMLYVSSTGCSAKVIMVSLPMYMSCDSKRASYLVNCMRGLPSNLWEVSASQRSKRTQNEYHLCSWCDNEMDELCPPVVQQSLSQSEACTPLSAEHLIICSGKPI